MSGANPLEASMAKYKVTCYLDRYHKSRVVEVDEEGLSEDDLQDELDEVAQEVTSELVNTRVERVE